jgi:hypothetical protein
MTITDQVVYELEKCLKRMKQYKRFPLHSNFHALALRSSRETRYLLGQWNNITAHLKANAEKEARAKDNV